jgi:hypothetical protein
LSVVAYVVYCFIVLCVLRPPLPHPQPIPLVTQNREVPVLVECNPRAKRTL